MRIIKLFVLGLLLQTGFVQAQTASTFTTLLDNITRYAKTYPQEKVHLHFDKPYYARGDTIWFGGYIVNADSNIPDYNSRTLHVELINSEDSVCKAMLFPVNIGFTGGDIVLNDSLQAGNYRVRAYTNWMHNFNTAYFFSKSISIVDPFPKSKVTAPPVKASAQDEYDIQFFPEGGDMVNGLTSSVAFKASSSSGNSIDITGKLVDELNNTVLEFKTTHAGMGAFKFTPVGGKTYMSIVNLPDGKTKIINLPNVQTSGYVLTADNTGPDSLTVTLLASPELVNKEEMVLMPLSNGNPLFYFKTPFPDSRVNVTIPKSKLPAGILQLTLFNSKNQPVAERLVFNNHMRRIDIQLDSIKQIYGTRSAVTLAFKATNSSNKPVIGSFSVAVTNADKVVSDEDKETTIVSNLLLTSDLKGYIESPNYYFTDPSPTKYAELNMLLLTQGWRRFVWNDVANGKLVSPKYPLTETMVVSGIVTDAKKQPVAGAKVNVVVGQLALGLILDTLTDANGSFRIHLPDSLRYLPMRIQAKFKSKQLLVALDQEANPEIIAEKYKSDVNSKALSKYAEVAAQQLTAAGKSNLFIKGTQLKEVVIKDYSPKAKLVNSTSNNLNGPGQADKVFTAADLEKLPSLIYLDLPGAYVTETYIMLRSVVGTHTPPVLILIDGQPGLGSLSEVSPRDIESIEFMKNIAYTGIYGIRGAGGVLLITTKKGNSINNAIDGKHPDVVILKSPYQLLREFYVPKYDGSSSKQAIADLRTTVFWKADVITDKAGKAIIKYYNNDVPGTYRVTVEGISAKGDLCRQVFTYVVK